VPTSVSPTLPVSTPTSSLDSTTKPTASPGSKPDLSTLPSGWKWYYNESHNFAVAYPKNWQQDSTTFHAPETNSQVQIRVYDLPTEQDWLDWVRDNQQDLITTSPVAPEQITANATVQGQPATFRLAEGGGSSQLLLVFPAGDRLIRFYFHSGVLPRLEAEMAIFRTMIEKIALGEDLAGETMLPTGWEVGGNLVTFPEVIAPATGTTPNRQVLTGTVDNWDAFRATITGDDGQPHTLQLAPGYHFRGLPRGMSPGVPGGNAIQAGDRISIVGYPLAGGDAFRPEFIAVEGEGDWRPVAYKSFFDLTWQTLDPMLLNRYPQDRSVQLWLRGSLTQTIPFLVDEMGNPLKAEALPADPGEDVLVKGSLQSVDPPRLTLTELFVHKGDCVMVSGRQETCSFWQPTVPFTTTTITATVRSLAVDEGVIVLEQPVQGFVTITLADTGQLLAADSTAVTWDDLAAGIQVQATGEAGKGGALLAQEIQIVASEE
jgi:hypothetical protein